MKVPPHVISLYVKTSRRYKKLISKIQREPSTSYQRKTFIHQLKKLVKLLQDLRWQLKIAAATGTVVLLLNSNPTQAQNSLGPFVKQNRINNPLREPIYNNNEPVLTVVDFDGDSDSDVVLGERDFNGGYLRYFENKTSDASPLYIELLNGDNPLDGIRSETSGIAPAFADIDKDGDLDLFLGQNGSMVVSQIPYSSQRGIEYYRNDGGVFSKQKGAWDDQTKEGNPFDGVLRGNKVRPVFIDFDQDNDLDVVIGSFESTGVFPNYQRKFIHYIENDGSGNFTISEVTLDTEPTNWYNSIQPALADLDEDGDYDLVIGSYYDGYLKYYKQTTPGNFVEGTSAWDPVQKTGNPFAGFDLGLNASPAFIDFNNDNLPDLFVADEDGFYASKYSDNIINYYKNSSNGVFTKIDGLENPFDGIHVSAAAAPILMDLDGDQDLDAVIGNKYDYTYYDPNTLTWVTNRSFATPYKKTDAGFEKIKGAENKFDGLEVVSKFVPQFADADGDNDLDIISGNYYGEVVFFRNDAGVYTQEIALSPFAGISAPFYGAARLVDIDNDTDLDLFISNNLEIRYFKNTGSAQSPIYTEEFVVNNPLNFATTYLYSTPFLNFMDLDHDGDFDLHFNGSMVPNSYSTRGLLYFENTGTVQNAVFQTPPNEVLFSEAKVDARMELIDYDADGDLDLFVGNEDGSVSYLKNENKIVATSVTAIVPLFSAGGPSVVIEPGLTLSDPDDDLIVQATVTVNNFESGETLSFTPAEGITGSFDATSGVLTFRGKASLADYQSLLRTVAFEDTDPDAGRKKPSRKLTYAKNISFAVYDIDFTTPQIVPKTINVFVNSPPLIQPEPISTPAGSTQNINLISITSDVDNNLDPLLFSIAIAPTSGATATIQVVSTTEVNLLLDYSGVTFHGTDQLTIRACDALGACAESILSVDIDVDGEITVYNAVAPNSSGDNQFMRITGLPEGHKINIYNRWGDQVFDAQNYLNTPDGNAFKGNGKNGNPLPTGTYFYTIEIPGKKPINGYLTLKQ